MSLYRCAACGSPNVMPDTQAGGVGYNYLKGTIGTVVLGAGGGAAGIESKREQIYRCPDCGLTLSYPMEPSMKALIDMGVVSMDVRKNMRATYGITWEALKSQYKNIESGYADDVALNNAQELFKRDSATKEEFDAAIDLIVETRRRLYEYEYSPQHPMTLMEYTAVRRAIDTCIQNVAKYLPPPVPKEYRGLDVPQRLFGLLPEYATTSDMPYEYRKYNQALTDYLNDTTFISDLAAFYENDSSLWWWVSDVLENKKLYYHARHRVDFSYSFLRCTCKVEKSFFGIEAQSVRYILPRFMIIDGLLCFWDASFITERGKELIPRNFYGHFNYQDIAENYFSYYPEKRAAVMAEIEDFKAKVKQYKAKEAENEKRLARLPSLESKKEENGDTIIKLGKKIFGRKQALAQIEILEEENAGIAKQIEDIQLKDETFKKEAPLSAKEFLNQLIEKNDYFIAWHSVYNEAAPMAQ